MNKSQIFVEEVKPTRKNRWIKNMAKKRKIPWPIKVILFAIAFILLIFLNKLVAQETKTAIILNVDTLSIQNTEGPEIQSLLKGYYPNFNVDSAIRAHNRDRAEMWTRQHNEDRELQRILKERINLLLDSVPLKNNTKDIKQKSKEEKRWKIFRKKR